MTANEQPANPYDEFFVADKNPEYIYKWCNTRERVMNRRIHQGYEVEPTPEQIPEAMKALNPALAEQNGTLRRRGDLVLMRIKKDVHARNVAGPIRQASERQMVALDTAIAQANENAQRQLRAAGYNNAQLRSSMVFTDSPEPFKR
jgi:hypothetical protein